MICVTHFFLSPIGINMSAFSRPVLLLLAGLLLFTTSMAVLNTLVPLWLNHASLSTWQVGVVSSAYFTGNLIGALIAGALINAFGFVKTYHGACALFIAATLLLGISVGFISWSAWRFLAGIACAMIWVVVESALLYNGALRCRGQLLAAYMLVYYTGTLIGQMLLGALPTALHGVLPWATGVLIASLLPLLFMRMPKPVSEEGKRYHVWSMAKRKDARLGVVGCMLSGVVLGSLYGLLPLYLSHAGYDNARVGYWMALIVCAGMMGQLPIGKLADRFGQLFILRIQVFVIIVSSLSVLSGDSLALSLFMLGLSGFTLYPIAMAWGCERASSDELITMNQTLLLSYTVGSLLGPALTAMLMQQYSDKLLFIVIAVSAAVFMTMLFRKAGRYHRPLTMQ
ncbi:putative MFS-type transporter [Leminorella grimontii]|uniref:Uncharacterized MFS-type transporter SOASR030_22160 n=2 Tax=Leminorella grimontii TaxID=82981 RepID=A0AAV5N4R8_9GAMM|nr:putative MFS-type transporter [Leminorella grimontii]VFS57920.1 Uncharacterized MFS-type transporter ycaD [Leminorella grimontii]